MMNKYDKASPSLFSNPWVFFGATFAWTWAFWGLGILLKISMEFAFGFGLLFLGVLGPMVTGIGFTYLTKNKAGRRDYWLRIIDVRRIGLIGTLEFWLFMIGIVPISFAFTWVYNNTHRSILAVILFHGMVNFTGELFDISVQANIYATVLWVVAALGITIFWGANTFTRQPRQEAWA